ncbi:MAG: MoaD/ThiS family protein [Verrucomicrobiales bacterium]|nr:MoaD/ThiS family protein [Verrucomicrobiales bacterium]
MKVKVLFFSVLQDVVGSPEIEYSLAAERSWTVAEVLADLYEKYEGLKIWDGKILLAVDQQYADRGDLLQDGQELAIMPPVQGG